MISIKKLTLEKQNVESDIVRNSSVKFLLRCMRFDNHRNRPVRHKNDRLAAIREVWKTFNTKLRKIYIPKEVLTVDEQLFGYRGKIP